MLCQEMQRKLKVTVVLCERGMADLFAVWDPMEDLLEEATCPICLEYFKDPVTLECGHNFCRACLTQCWEKPEDTETSCPLCREKVPQRKLRTNKQLAEIIKKLSLQGSRRGKGQERFCGIHQEPLKLFCKDDEASICVVCDRSKEHRNHAVIPMVEAAQDYKELMIIRQDDLEKKKENILLYKTKTEKEVQDLLKQKKAEMKETLEEITQLRLILEKQEKHLRAQMEELEKQITRERDERSVLFSEEVSSLESLIQEMKEKSQQPPAELLQDVKSLMLRFEEKQTFEKPVAFPPKLKWKIWEFCDLNSFVTAAMKPSRDVGMLSKSFTENVLQVNAKESDIKCALCKSDMAAAPRAQDPFQDLCKEATCSVCLDYFKDPVTLDCGHNFCRACLTQCWAKPDNAQNSCPHCREISSLKNLRTNQLLANFVEITKKLSLQRPKKAKGKEKVCEKHQEPLNHFCTDDETLVCVVCSRSNEHVNHRMIPLGTAAQKYKVSLKVLMGLRQDDLVKEREKILVYKAETEKEAQDLLKQTKAKTEKALEEITEMQQFLKKQEKHLRAQMKDLERQIARKRDEHLVLLSWELSSLESLIQEMKEKCQQPPAELLQDVRNLWQRCEARKEFRKPDVFPPELKWKIWDYGDIALFLEVTMKQVRDELISGLTLQKANVTLDPDTAHDHLILSEDRKSVTYENTSQNLPDKPKRFKKTSSVLGCDGFTSGRHFWEICVGEEEQWLAGVARKTMERNYLIVYGPEGGIWAIGKWGNTYRVTNNNQSVSLNSELKRVRVSLNYAGGQVAFYDADTGDHLYSFSGASFTGETLLPFFNVSQKGHLRISSAKESENNSVLCKSDMAAAPRAQDPLQDLCDEATCLICLDYLKDPVSLECGHNFCRACLTQTWKKSGNIETSCSHCREPVSQKNLRTNQQLANLVEKVKILSLQGSKKAKGKEGVCEKHQEPLKFFCKDDETPICEMCDREHRDHRRIPLGTAAQDYKLLIRLRQDDLVKKREKILAYKTETEKEAQELLKQAKTKMETTLEEIPEIQQFLDKQEQHPRSQMEELQKQIAQKRDEHLVLLSRELSSLEGFIQELKEKCQQPPAELLRDVRNLLQRCEEKQTSEKPMAFPPELKWKVWEFCDLNSYLVAAMKPFRAAFLDALLPGLELQKANVTLDPNTAGTWLILSEDQKSVRFGDEPQDLLDNPERFSDRAYVLGQEGFTSGRHFWDVVVGEEGDWAVGVARESVRRKGLVNIDPEEGIWVVSKWRGKYHATSWPSSTDFLLSEKTKRVRVCLNYAANQVAFYDADTGDQICLLSEVPFSGETVFPFFHVHKKGHLRISP
ncbi:uncharacterized protein LOC100560312 [Anolis carolinensis]|uniref:uncharacterized protein LOC100560312 n=1 Tax=Anolis carolinensis TaxID=28377 RepID=UPI002F2B2C81